MTVHSEKVEKHAVHTSVENMQNELSKTKEIDNTPEAIEVIARITLIVKNLCSSMENCNKELIAIPWLDDASKALANIKSYVATYISNKDANALRNNSNSQLDILLQTTVKLNCVKSNQHLRGIINAQNEYAEFVNSQNQLLTVRVKELEEEIYKFKNDIYEQEVSSQKQMETLKESVDSERKRLDGFATSYQQQMQADQGSFSSMSEKLKNSFLEMQEEQKRKFYEQSKKIDDDTVNLIDEYNNRFHEYEQQVKDIVGIVNTNMFSHKYKQVADDAHNRARFWHGVAMILMILVGAFAFYAFIITVNVDTSWVKLVAKIFATTTFVTAAAYAARQASKQEKVERYARKIEMELVAIDPFIQSLEDEKKSAIKEEIARKIFGNADAMEISQKEEPYKAMDKLTSIEETLHTLVGVIGKIPK